MSDTTPIHEVENGQNRHERYLYSHELKRVCGWCQKYLGGPKDSPHVSHGMCEPCLEREMREAGITD